MKDEDKTKAQLIAELREMRRLVSEFEKTEPLLVQAKEELREEAIRRRILVEQSRDGIVVLDENGKVDEANQRYADLLGYSMEEVLQLHVWDWDTQWTREQLLEMIRTVDETGDHFETFHRRKDGTCYDVEISTNGAIFGGQKLVFCVCRDISTRKRAEEALAQKIIELHSFINNIPDMAWLKDADSRFIAANRAFCGAVGMGPESLISQTCEVCFGKEAAKKFREDDQKVMKAKKQVIVEEKITDPQENEVWLETIKSPILDESGKVAGTVGIARDISTRKRAEEALKKAHDELETQVEKRTAELLKANQKLKGEIEERKRAEEALRESEEELKAQADSLNEVNTALKVLLKRREEDKAELEGKVLSNVKELVMPYVESLKNSRLGATQKAYVSIIKSNLTEIVSPFLQTLSLKYVRLTPRQIQIADLIRLGKTTKEIAGLLNVSPRAVEFHRGNIRRKLGLKNQRVNLRTHLLSFR